MGDTVTNAIELWLGLCLLGWALGGLLLMAAYLLGGYRCPVKHPVFKSTRCDKRRGHTGLHTAARDAEHSGVHMQKEHHMAGLKQAVRIGSCYASEETFWWATDEEYEANHRFYLAEPVEQDVEIPRPCTCTLACTPQGLAPGQVCRLGR